MTLADISEPDIRSEGGRPTDYAVRLSAVVADPSLSRVQLFATPGTAALQCPLPSPGACSSSCPSSR